jgi:hypothetical protein
MKTNTLVMSTLIAVLTGGCMSGGYSPASPDYYPIDSPPFSGNSAPDAPAPGKVTVARLAPSAVLSAPQARVDEDAAL